MAALVILVEFSVKPKHTAQFLKLLRANATQSLREEPGCKQFDVLQPDGDPNRIVLYEIYDDAAAFDDHLGRAHYKSFAAATENLVDGKSVRRLGFVAAGSEP